MMPSVSFNGDEAKAASFYGHFISFHNDVASIYAVQQYCTVVEW
jgi:hypothetical protein